jgi:hypothetical protein
VGHEEYVLRACHLQQSWDHFRAPHQRLSGPSLLKVATSGNAPGSHRVECQRRCPTITPTPDATHRSRNVSHECRAIKPSTRPRERRVAAAMGIAGPALGARARQLIPKRVVPGCCPVIHSRRLSAGPERRTAGLRPLAREVWSRRPKAVSEPPFDARRTRGRRGGNHVE